MRESAYKNYLLTILLVVLAFNLVDRLALGLLLQDIKVDLDLTDTQLGFLTGIAFALFYSLMGIPIARWADRGNRVTIISVTVALWSIAVALCGVAASFLQLMLIRIGAAVGEAGCIPPAHSLIADYFTRAERPRAVARYMLGAPLSAALGYFLAGWLNELYGWRATFIILGLPGIAIALLTWLTLKEPRERTGTREPAAAPVPIQPGMKEAFGILWVNKTFRHLLFGFSVACFFANGIFQWMPALFIRSYGIQTGELGSWFAIIAGAGGLLGTYWGGEWASRYAAHNERLQLKVMAILYCGYGVISTLIYLSPNQYWAFSLLALATIGSAAANGPLFATIQTLVPDRLRATSIAIVYLFSNLIGMGLGPLVAGALSDALRPWAGEESLRYALMALSPGYSWAAWHLWRASGSVARDLQAAAR
jgi:MFS family permease